MSKMLFKDIVRAKDGFLRGPFGGALKKEIFVPKGNDTIKVYEQGVVLNKDESIGNYYISKEYFDTAMYRFETKEKDFLVSCSGVNYGAIYQLKRGAEIGVINQALLRIRLNNELICDDFFRYYFESYIVRKITGGTGDSTIPNFPPMNVIKNIEIDIPNISTQKQIAAVLSSLDEKIELNNKINAELEAMAKTIYDYWFVQFDFPDENGRPFKSSGGNISYNKILKRYIPEGWEDGTLESLGEIIGGSTPSKDIADNFSTNGIAWITPKDLSLNRSNKFISKGEFDVTNKGFKAASLKLMPKGTILLSSRAPIGYMAIARNSITTNQGFKSFVPNRSYSTPYIFYTIKNALPEIINNACGSTFKEISGSTLKGIKVYLPNQAIVKSYTEKVASIFERQNLLEVENEQLSELRDWLLPMLMNGQIRVGEAKERVEEVLSMVN